MLEVTLAALFGLLIGSFLNVLIIRLPEGKSIVFPPSHCTKCNQNLKWYHNIPLISWLLLRGRCAYCKEPISVQYPIIELLSALIFGAVAFKEGITIYSIDKAIIFDLLLALSLIDLRYKAVPDSINLLAAILALWSTPNLLENLKNALLMAGGFTMLRFFVSYYVSKKMEIQIKKEVKKAPWLTVFYPRHIMIEAMGEGDIIVAFTMGALLGIQGSMIAIFIAAILALPASIIWKIYKKEQELPFVPFLAAGTFFVYLFDERLTTLVQAL